MAKLTLDKIKELSGKITQKLQEGFANENVSYAKTVNEHKMKAIIALELSRYLGIDSLYVVGEGSTATAQFSRQAQNIGSLESKKET